jgi:peptide/nickel transport system substrate-binding protein
MKKTKRLLALLLCMALVVSVLGSCKKQPEASPTPVETTPSADVSPTPDEDTELSREELIAQAKALPAPSGQIIRGSTTDVNAYMYSGIWQNSASNADISYLLGLRLAGGYATIVWSKTGLHIVNPIVVKNYDAKENADGTKTFTFEIYDDLKWNDGTGITAKDYVGAALFLLSDELAEIDGDNAGGEVFVGGIEYSAGETDVLAGVRLLGDYSFSLTLAAEELPNHYELSSLQVDPLPIAVIAPGVTVSDDGTGAKFSEEYTEDLIRGTMLDENTGYAFKPTVTAGPYKFESFDASTKTAVLVADPNYISTYDGYKAQVEKIVLKHVESSTMMDELRTGSVDLLDGTSSGDEINVGLDLVDAGGFSYTNYPRNGFGYVVFKCDKGVTQFVEVRQALGWLLDRNEFAKNYASGYAMVVDSYYGASQPEYQLKKDELDEKLTHYTFNAEKAASLLNENGWNLDASGNAYTSGVRYKKFDDAAIAALDELTKALVVGGNLVPLSIEWMSSEQNPVSDLLTTMLLPEAEKAGFKINKTQVDFTTLLTNYYREGIPDSPYTMFNLAVGFEEVNLYWYFFSTDPQYADLWNDTNINDPDGLEKIANQMKNVPAEDLDMWTDLWVDLMVRYNELLPTIPLYSNDYHDFYSAKLKGYDVSPTWDWARAIVRCAIG